MFSVNAFREFLDAHQVFFAATELARALRHVDQAQSPARDNSSASGDLVHVAKELRCSIVYSAGCGRV